MADDQPFYAPDYRPTRRRQPTPGFKQWELRHGDRVVTCEFRENERQSAGVDIQLLENGELLVAMRCITGDARYVADAFRQEYARQGWTAVE